jgi:hypothetical protein
MNAFFIGKPVSAGNAACRLAKLKQTSAIKPSPHILVVFIS